MILVCAPTRTEADACRRGLADAGARGEVLRCGVGPARAAAALRARLAAGARPALVVSSGFAGALTGGVPLHGAITAASVHRLLAGRTLAVALPPGALRRVAGALPCGVVTTDAVVTGLASPIAAPAAVDLESAALAELAAEAGVPFAVLRVVTDTPDAPFPPFVRAIGVALAAAGVRARVAASARAAAGIARAPVRAGAFVASSLAAARALRAEWARAAPALTAEARAAGAAAEPPPRAAPAPTRR